MKVPVLLVLLSIVLISCTNTRDEVKDTLVFNIDSSRIAPVEKIDSSGITFHPPLNWKEVDSDMSEKLMKSVNPLNEKSVKFIYKPIKIFLEQSSFSILSVGTVLPSVDTDTSANNLKNYESIVSENFAESILKEGSFYKNGAEVYQYLIQKSNLISFKLIFEFGNVIYQFDYSCPQKNYEEQIKSIESSIGTINL